MGTRHRNNRDSTKKSKYEILLSHILDVRKKTMLQHGPVEKLYVIKALSTSDYNK